MMYDIPMVEGDYKKEQEAVKKKIDSLSSKSEIVKHAKKMEEAMKNPEKRKNVRVARMLMDEGISMYEKGMMNWEEFISDLTTALKAVNSEDK